MALCLTCRGAYLIGFGNMTKKGRIFGVASSAVGLGGVAAALGTCCVAPWAVALLGVSGAVTLARFALYQPYILAGATLLLGLAFYWVYRAEPDCADGSCDAINRKRMRWIVWGAALLLAALTALSFLPAFWPVA